MALIVPNGPSFAHWSDNLGPLNNGQTIGFGTELISTGVANTDTADTTLMTALAHDCEYFVVGMQMFGATASQANVALMDVLVDPAGGTSWSTLIADLMVGSGGVNVSYNSSSAAPPPLYHFPLWIPAGSSLGVRARWQTTASRTAHVFAQAAGGNRNPASWWCGQKVETVGTIAGSTSTGQAITPAIGALISGAADNGSGLIRLTVNSTTPFATGNVLTVSGVVGTTEANGTWTITVVNSTTLDLQGSTFVNAYSAGTTPNINGNFSSWTDLGSPISARTGAVQWGVGGPSSATWILATTDHRFGAGGNQIGPRVYRGQMLSECGQTIYHGPIFCDLPAGTQLQVKAASSATSSGAGLNMGCLAYCVQ